MVNAWVGLGLIVFNNRGIIVTDRYRSVVDRGSNPIFQIPMNKIPSNINTENTNPIMNPFLLGIFTFKYPGNG